MKTETITFEVPFHLLADFKILLVPRLRLGTCFRGSASS